MEREGFPVVDPRKTCVFNVGLATISLAVAGSGKNILYVAFHRLRLRIFTRSSRSTIIREIDRMRKAGLALMAYFFFDFRDTQKQH